MPADPVLGPRRASRRSRASTATVLGRSRARTRATRAGARLGSSATATPTCRTEASSPRALRGPGAGLRDPASRRPVANFGVVIIVRAGRASGSSRASSRTATRTASPGYAALPFNLNPYLAAVRRRRARRRRPRARPRALRRRLRQRHGRRRRPVHVPLLGRRHDAAHALALADPDASGEASRCGSRSRTQARASTRRSLVAHDRRAPRRRALVRGATVRIPTAARRARAAHVLRLQVVRLPGDAQHGERGADPAEHARADASVVTVR